MPTKSATLSYDFDRSVSLHPKEAEKTGRLDTYTTTTISSSIPQSILTHSETECSGFSELQLASIASWLG